MGDKRTDSGQFYPGGRVIARPGTAPQQVVVQWSDVQGKPQIAPLPERYRDGDMKEKINEIASKFAVLAAVALVSWASFAELVVTRATKGSLWNDDLVVVDVKELGGGVNTNAVLSLIDSSVGGTNSLAHAVKTNDQGVASIDGLQVSYVGANMITGNSGVLWLGSGQTSPGTSITYDASTGNDVLSAAVVMDAAGNVLSAKANRSEIPDVTADFTSPTSSGKAADAKAVGDAIGAVEEDAEHAQDTASEALDGAATAYNMASEAQTNAVTAMEYANEAYKLANEALGSADTADNHAQLAYELAETKYLKDAAGIPLGDLEQSVQDALAKADSALQDEQDPFATAKANAAIAAAGCVRTNEYGMISTPYGTIVGEKTEFNRHGIFDFYSFTQYYFPFDDGWGSNPQYDFATVDLVDTARDLAAAAQAHSEATRAMISETNETFSAAVLAVGLNIDTNSVAVLNEIAATFGDFPITGTATTVGGLLAALAAAVAWLRRKKIDKLTVTGMADEVTTDNGVAKLDDFFKESNTLLGATIEAKIANILANIDPDTASVYDLIKALKGE